VEEPPGLYEGDSVVGCAVGTKTRPGVMRERLLLALTRYIYHLQIWNHLRLFCVEMDYFFFIRVPCLLKLVFLRSLDNTSLFPRERRSCDAPEIYGSNAL